MALEQNETWDHVSLSSGQGSNNNEYWDRIGWGFSHRISDIWGDIRDACAYRAFILDTIYNEILITKSWFSVINIIQKNKKL